MEAESSTSRRPIEDQEQAFHKFVEDHHASLMDRLETKFIKNLIYSTLLSMYFV